LHETKFHKFRKIQEFCSYNQPGYVTLNNGQVRCFRYVVTNVAPTVKARATPDSGSAPLTVQFSADGTFDRENDQMLFLWNFGDGSPVVEGWNPQHTFTQSGRFDVVLTVYDKWGNRANQTIPIFTNNARPVYALFLFLSLSFMSFIHSFV
jgi:PKD repeat protein